MVILALSLTTASQKGSNIMFTDRHSNCSRRLLPAPRHYGCLSCRPFYRTHFGICCVVDSKIIFTELSDSFYSNLFSCYVMKIIRQISDSLLDSYSSLAAQCECEYRQ